MPNWRMLAVMAAVAVWLAVTVGRAVGGWNVAAPPHRVVVVGECEPWEPQPPPPPRTLPIDDNDDSDSDNSDPEEPENELDDDIREDSGDDDTRDDEPPSSFDVDMTPPGGFMPVPSTTPAVVNRTPPPPPIKPSTTVAPPPRDRPVVSTARPGMTMFPLSNMGGLNFVSKSRVPPVVTKNGKQAFEVRYEGGEKGPGAVNTNFLIAPKQFFPSTQARFAFKWWVDDDWPWTPGNPKKIGGKVIGFKIGTGDMSGGNYSKTGSSLRLSFAERGGIGPYLYPQVKNPKSRKDGNPVNERDLDQNSAFWKIAYLSGGGIHMFYPKGRKQGAEFPLQFKKKQWNDLEMFIRLNTPGKFDGIIEVTVNGSKMRFDQARFRYDDAKINGVNLVPFFGGGTKEYAPSKDMKSWYADFAFSAS